MGNCPPTDGIGNESLIYVSLVPREDGSHVMLMLHSPISPVSSTVETLRVQLLNYHRDSGGADPGALHRCFPYHRQTYR